MKQQVNLYQKEFHLKQVMLPARQMLIITISVSSFLLFISGILFVVEKIKEKELEQLTVESNSLKNSNSAMQVNVDNLNIDEKLNISVVEASRQLQARQRIMEWVDQSNDEKRVNFSSLLEGLGRQHVPGLWLSTIQIDTGGHALNLKGNALNPKLMPELLAKLNIEPAFLGREFKKILLEEDEKSSGVMNFVLTTDINDPDNVGDGS